LPALGGQARADGALPGSLGIMLPVDRPQEIVLSTNFGLIISNDRGATWLWTCEQLATSMANRYAVGPPPAATGSLGDRFYALSPIKGLAISDDETCSWQPSAGALAGETVTDFFVDPTSPDRVLAAAAAPDDAGDVAASIYESMDGGATFDSTPLFVAPVGATVVGVEIARSDPDVITLAYYLTTASDAGVSGFDPVLVRSSDGGRTWGAPIDVQVALGPNIVRILAVDPADSNLVYLRVSAITSGTESVAITRDGGMTFTQPVTIDNGSVSAFARLASGTVLVGALINLPGGGGGTRGAGYRSTDGGMTFTSWNLSPQPHIVGLAERASGAQSILYLSGKNYSDDWALATSTDEGITVTPVMSYDEVRGIQSCAQAACADTCNYEEGQAVWSENVCTGALLDAGTVTPPPAGSGCHCGADGGDSGGLSIVAFVLLFGLPLARPARRRRPGRDGADARKSSSGLRLDSRRTAV
jgi:hypothetical protein